MELFSQSTLLYHLEVTVPGWNPDNAVPTLCYSSITVPGWSNVCTVPAVPYIHQCSTTGKPTRSFATERVSLDSV